MLETSGFRYKRVGEARLLWFEARVGVYLTERVEELVVSDVALRRRVRTGIFEAGDGRTRSVLRGVAPLPERW